MQKLPFQQPVEGGSELSFQLFRSYAAEGENALIRVISYFQERMEIERNYYASLERLSNKMSPDGVRGSTTSQAWIGMSRLNGELSKIHVELGQALTNAVKDLLKARDGQEKMMKSLLANIREDQKAYNELKTQTVPKLKQAYQKKCRDQETIEKDPKEPITSQKNMKLAKDVNAADAAYRKGVMDLEAARYQLNRARERAQKACEQSEKERIRATRAAFTKSLEAEKKLCEDRMKVVDDFSVFIECIKPEVDLNLLEPEFHRVWPEAQMVPYEHHKLGEAKSMAFGVPLDMTVRGPTVDEVPLVLYKLTKDVEARGLNREGIYRVPGKQTDVFDLRALLEKDVHAVPLPDTEDRWDVNVSAALVKMYLRELPAPLFAFPAKERAEYSHVTDERQRVLELRRRLKQVPPSTVPVLKFTLEHLATVASHASENKMTIQNLALIFAPVVFGQGEMPGDNGSLPDGGTDRSAAGGGGGGGGKLASFWNNLRDKDQGGGGDGAGAAPGARSLAGAAPGARTLADLAQFEIFKLDGVLEEMVNLREKIFSHELPHPPPSSRRISSVSSFPVPQQPPSGGPNPLLSASTGIVPTRMESLPLTKRHTDDADVGPPVPTRTPPRPEGLSVKTVASPAGSPGRRSVDSSGRKSEEAAPVAHPPERIESMLETPPAVEGAGRGFVGDAVGGGTTGGQ